MAAQKYNLEDNDLEPAWLTFGICTLPGFREHLRHVSWKLMDNYVIYPLHQIVTGWQAFFNATYRFAAGKTNKTRAY